MLYNVSFMLNGVDCANLVDDDADMETVKEYFIHEHLNGDKNRFVGISENNESFHLSPCLSSVELLDNLSGSGKEPNSNENISSPSVSTTVIC